MTVIHEPPVTIASSSDSPGCRSALLSLPADQAAGMALASASKLFSRAISAGISRIGIMFGPSLGAL
jgi:hypothetical protein